MNGEMSPALARTFDARWDARNAESQANQQAVEQEVLAELHALVDPALHTRQADLGAALQEASRAVQVAEQRVRTHVAQPPQSASGVSEWARRKAELAAEVEGYVAVREAAQRADDVVRSELAQALHAVWVSQHATTQAAFEAGQQQEQDALAAARAALEQQTVEADQRVGALRAARNRYRRVAQALGIDVRQHMPTIEQINGHWY